MAAPTLAQFKVSTATSATTSGSVTFDNAVASGAFIVVFVYSSVNYSGLGISDGGGNTYTQRAQAGYADMWGRVYTAPASNAPGAISITQSSGYLTIVACEVNSYLASDPIEKSGNVWATRNSGDSPISDLNFTGTTNAEQLFLACMGLSVVSGSTNWTAGTDWTLVNRVVDTTGKIGHVCISRAVTSTGTYDPTWTTDFGGSRNVVELGISVIAGNDGSPTGGGGGGVPKSTKFFLMGIG
jgi:hypothetical protein